MQTYSQIQVQVGAWSLKNFGAQFTPYLEAHLARNETTDIPLDEVKAVVSPFHETGMLVALGSLAPLMGLVEELGELAEAEIASDKEGIRDSCADMAIYMCDYLCRENLTWPTTPAPRELATHGKESLQAALGKLYRAHLKRHQRIRGMHNPGLFHEARSTSIMLFVWHLKAYAREVAGEDLLILLNEVWNKIVSKRDWNQNAKEGA